MKKHILLTGLLLANIAGLSANESWTDKAKSFGKNLLEKNILIAATAAGTALSGYATLKTAKMCGEALSFFAKSAGLYKESLPYRSADYVKARLSDYDAAKMLVNDTTKYTLGFGAITLGLAAITYYLWTAKSQEAATTK